MSPKHAVYDQKMIAYINKIKKKTNIYKAGVLKEYISDVESMIEYVREQNGVGLEPFVMEQLYTMFPKYELPEITKKQFIDIIIAIKDGDLSKINLLKEFLINSAKHKYRELRKSFILETIYIIDDLEDNPHSIKNIEIGKKLYKILIDLDMNKWDLDKMVNDIKNDDFELYWSVRKYLIDAIININEN